VTKVQKEKIQCHICGVEYEGLIVYSWNEQLSGPFPKDKYKVSCPKCGVPYRAKINPSVGTAKNFLMKMISNPEEASELLFKLSLTEEDLNRWKNIILEIDYEEWEKHDLEFRKSMKHLSENEAAKLDENSQKREELARLKRDGKIQEIIEKTVGLARKKIKEEKDLYLAS
jgi:hypothetical protein